MSISFIFYLICIQSTIIGSSSLLSCGWDKHCNQKQLGDERLYFSLYFQVTAREVKAGTQEGRAVPFTNLFPGSCSMSFHIQPRTTCLGMVLSTVDCVLLYQIAIKKMGLRHGHKSDIGNSSFEGHSYQKHQVDNEKLASNRLIIIFQWFKCSVAIKYKSNAWMKVPLTIQ